MKERMSELKRARKARELTQSQMAQRLGVSQGYVSLLESGRRSVPEGLLPKLRRELNLSPTTLPARESKLNQGLPGALAALGYRPFGYLHGRTHNPAQLLLAALRQKDLPSRVVEGLPWLVLRHPDLDWKWLVERAKVHDVQNRLAYVLTLALHLAEGRRVVRVAKKLRSLLARLEPSRLAREDTLCRDSMTQAERRFLREQRPPDAAHWNLLTGLSADQLSNVA